jgi:hypothetical protein
MNNSTILTAAYTINIPGQVEQPVATPPQGNYIGEQNVTLESDTEGANIPAI